jgi:hypothetical protein
MLSDEYIVSFPASHYNPNPLIRPAPGPAPAPYDPAQAPADPQGRDARPPFECSL